MGGNVPGLPALGGTAGSCSQAVVGGGEFGGCKYTPFPVVCTLWGIRTRIFVPVRYAVYYAVSVVLTVLRSP